MIASTTMPTMINDTVVNASFFLMKTAPSDSAASLGSKLLIVVPVTFRMSVSRPPPVTEVGSTPSFTGTSAPTFALLAMKFNLVSLGVSWKVPTFSGAFGALSTAPGLVGSLSMTAGTLYGPGHLVSYKDASHTPKPGWSASFGAGLLVVIFLVV